MRVVDLVQGSEEWLRWKKHRIGGTLASTLMGHPYESPETVWQSFNYDTPIDNKNAAMRHGNEYEAQARKALETHVEEQFTPICGALEDYDFVSVSLDGISNDGKIIAEIKCPFNPVMFFNQIKKIPYYYYSQVQHALLVTGAELCCFWSWYKGQHALHLIYPNNTFQTEMLAREFYFYSCFLRKETPDFGRFSKINI